MAFDNSEHATRRRTYVGPVDSRTDWSVISRLAWLYRVRVQREWTGGDGAPVALSSNTGGNWITTLTFEGVTGYGVQ